MKRNWQKLCCALLVLGIIAFASGCKADKADAPVSKGDSSPVQQTKHPENLILLEGDAVSFVNKAVSVSGNTVRITKAGEYVLSGTLNDGRIQIETGKGEKDVTLILDNAHITCLKDSALHVAQANKLKLVLAEGTQNSITSGTPDMLEKYNENASGAAVYSEDDLDLEGTGSVQIFGYINNGITCKDDLTVQGGNVTVVAANNGLRASESVQFEDGNVTVTANNDGIKTTSSKKEGKGYISFLGGTATVSAAGDAVSAETEFNMMGGTLVLTTAGDPEQKNCKGIKANTAVIISGGHISANTADHCIKSDVDLLVQGGTLELESTDGKGLSAEREIRVEGGDITIRSVDDGMDTPCGITITGGKLNIAAGEDGIKAGKSGETDPEKGLITIGGGEIFISAYQDGVDAKSKLSITGGTIFALSNTTKNLNFGNATAQPVFFGQLMGLSGKTVTLSDATGQTLYSLDAAYSFHTVQLTAQSLAADGAYTAASAGESVQLGK